MGEYRFSLTLILPYKDRIVDFVIRERLRSVKNCILVYFMQCVLNSITYSVHKIVKQTLRAFVAGLLMCDPLFLWSLFLTQKFHVFSCIFFPKHAFTHALQIYEYD